MPSLPTYMPAQEAQFNTWLLNFSTRISADPGAFGLSVGDAATIAAQVAVWSAAYAPILSPATKTADAVTFKNTARVIVAAQMRIFAQVISNNPGVASGNKTAIGVSQKNAVPRPIAPPVTNPVLALQSASNLSAYVRYRDSATSVSSKAKPFGVTQCRVFGATSATPITNPDTLPLIAAPTKSPFVLNFQSSQEGLPLYLAARWAIQTDAVGPWSPIIKFTVLAGG